MKNIILICIIMVTFMIKAEASEGCGDSHCSSNKPAAESEGHSVEIKNNNIKHAHLNKEISHKKVDSSCIDHDHGTHKHAEIHDHLHSKKSHSDNEHIKKHQEKKNDGNDSNHKEHDTCGGDHGDEKFSPGMAEKLGIKISKAKGGMIEVLSVFPAEIILNRDKAASVSARYSSVIRQVFANVSDNVQKGDILASLENRETLAVYTVSSPLNGVVVSKNASVGESALEDRVLFEVADLSSVWADISIFPQYLHKIKTGMEVTFIANDGHKTKGIIEYISPLVSKETRTYTARCVLNEAKSDFLPGAFVKAKIITESSKVKVRVETKAVHMIEDTSVVFVNKNGEYITKDVVLGKSDQSYVEIKKGLAVGESYVSEGSFTLKAELITSGMDPHAGHGH